MGGLTADEFSSSGRPSLALEVTQRLTGLELPSDRDLERLLLYTVLTRAVEHLELVRLKADSEGVATRPSIFWEELLDLYRVADPDSGGGTTGVRMEELAMNDLASAAPMVTGDRRRARASARSSAGRSRS